MKTSHKGLWVGFYTSAGLSTAILVTGFAISGTWTGVAAAVIVAGMWWFAARNTNTWATHFCLLASTGLAAVAIFTGTPGWLMLPVSGMVLVAWDLLLHIFSMRHSPDGIQNQRYTRIHLSSLLVSTVAGTLIALLFRQFQFDIPFILIVVFVILFLFGMDRFWRITGGQANRARK